MCRKIRIPAEKTRSYVHESVSFTIPPCPQSIPVPGFVRREASTSMILCTNPANSSHFSSIPPGLYNQTPLEGRFHVQTRQEGYDTMAPSARPMATCNVNFKLSMTYAFQGGQNNNLKTGNSLKMNRLRCRRYYISHL